MKDLLKGFIENAIQKLSDAETKLSSDEVGSIVIDNTYFDEKYMYTDITEATEDFKHLKTIKNPVLYWFELDNSGNNAAIRDKYIGYREPMKRNYSDPNYRNTSSYKSKYEPTSKTLYVGKVEKSFWGRLVTHLGYNRSEKTAGMQLNHWYDPNLYGNIKLNYIELDLEMKHLIVILEKDLAKELKPLIGRY